MLSWNKIINVNNYLYLKKYTLVSFITTTRYT
jgi:hypothetical protein